MAAKNTTPKFAALKNGQKRYFSEFEWKLLGPNKEGWVRTSDQVVTAKTEVKLPPATGDKKPTEVKTITVAPEIVPTAIVEEDKKQVVDLKTKEVSHEQKAEFAKAVDGYSKNAIKNYFDSKNEAYDKKASLFELGEKLGEFLNWDLNKLQEEFK